jgi:hypothetical protein
VAVSQVPDTKVGVMTEPFKKTKKPTREKVKAILSRFGDVTKPGTVELFIGGVRPPQKSEKHPDESMKVPEGTKAE